MMCLSTHQLEAHMPTPMMNDRDTAINQAIREYNVAGLDDLQVRGEWVEDRFVGYDYAEQRWIEVNLHA